MSFKAKPPNLMTTNVCGYMVSSHLLDPDPQVVQTFGDLVTAAGSLTLPAAICKIIMHHTHTHTHTHRSSTYQKNKIG